MRTYPGNAIDAVAHCTPKDLRASSRDRLGCYATNAGILSPSGKLQEMIDQMVKRALDLLGVELPHLSTLPLESCTFVTARRDRLLACYP
jgi:hypothetical protein